MTLSEYVQAHRIRLLLEGRDADGVPPALRCGNGAVVIVAAGVGRASYPRTDDGPWTMFAATWTSGPSPVPHWPGAIGETVSVHAGPLVQYLTVAGWPPELGRPWRKPRTAGVPGRE